MSAGRTVVAVIALLSGFTLHGQCSTVSFRGAAEWYGGQQPVALKFANINGDRWPDLVVASRDQNRKPLGGLTVLVGDGGRLWPVHQELVPTHNVQSFVVADLDNDGDDDVAYLQGLTDGDETSGRHVRILLNFDGQLRETNALLAAGSSQRTLITADFNGDDRADLALPTDSALLVWLGRGDGAFNQLSLPVPAGREAVAGDLDRDGRDELVIGDTAPDKTQRILIYKGSSSGLGATRAIALPSEAAFVSIADVDGDGAKDIVTNDYFTLVVNVVLRAGDPQRYEVRSAFADVAGYSPPLVADLNGDGADELTLYDWVLGVRSLFGSATAQLPGGRGHYVPRLPGTGGLGPGELDAADVDGDADLD
ncbi:MAG TPA: VCBS repeat-containing protein, partial [Thermoanaerobaculia bacterium]|nr:VCBS repeat-containing protein [Thermoanaerobaculia bacterium]